MGILLNFPLEIWQNKGNIFYVYRLLLVLVVIDNIILSGMAANH